MLFYIRYFLLFIMFNCYLSSYFYDNQYIDRVKDTLEAFDIDTSFQLDSNLIQIYYEQAIGNKWEQLIESFDRSYEYIPILKRMLVDNDVPQEFLYLAMAESEFATHANSPKKASGIWQIMPSTARSLGLNIDQFIDERRDPIKSTKAAINYLKFLKNKTGKWYLAAMAYNCGIGRLQKAIKEAGSNDINVLLDEDKKYIPAETRNYIRMIISMNIAFNNISELKNIEKEYFLNRGAILSLASIKVEAGTSMESIAKGAGISIDELKKYNRQFNYNFLPIKKGDYDVYIPYNNLLSFKQNFKPQKVNLDNFIVLYSVKKGDSLYSIARKHNISVANIKNMNNLSRNLISINQKLLIPIIPTKLANNKVKK